MNESQDPRMPIIKFAHDFDIFYILYKNVNFRKKNAKF